VLLAFLCSPFGSVPGEHNHVGDDDKDDRQDSTKDRSQKSNKD